MRVAVFLDGEPTSGGGFHYEISLARKLQSYPNINLEFIFFITVASRKKHLESLGLKVVILPNSIFSRMKNLLLRNVKLYSLFRVFNFHRTNFDKILLKENIDLVYFLSPSERCMDLSYHNYIITVWDLCHRDHVEFPEVRNEKVYEKRENLYSRYLSKAVAVSVESEFGRENIVRRYGIDQERVIVLPLTYSESVEKEEIDLPSIDIKKKYQIEGDYVFYPAQFWAHKNHVYIVQALSILKNDHNVIITAVFSGTDKGNLNFILSEADRLHVREQIRYVGFVDSNEIPSLYRQSLSLVMPTYFGPTNIPPLEAFKLGVPVCYSNLVDLADQVGDAAWLLDLKDPRSLVQSLLEILNDKTKVEKRREAGFKKIQSLASDGSIVNLVKILEDFQIKRNCWGKDLS